MDPPLVRMVLEGTVNWRSNRGKYEAETWTYLTLCKFVSNEVSTIFRHFFSRLELQDRLTRSLSTINELLMYVFSPLSTFRSQAVSSLHLQSAFPHLMSSTWLQFPLERVRLPVRFPCSVINIKITSTLRLGYTVGP